MSKQPNLLAHVRHYLINRGEEYQWVTMGESNERIGLAYLPLDTTGIPCTFMFTELYEPCRLVFDVHFATRVAREDLEELALLLLTLNANLPEGQLELDTEGGFVYYRLICEIDVDAATAEVADETVSKLIAHMEEVGVEISRTYAQIINQEFFL